MTAHTPRTLPDPWAVCVDCRGPAPALSIPGDHSPLCPTCARFHALGDAASASLEALLTPHLAAWGHHWQAVGVPMKELHGIIELVSGAWAHADHERRYQEAALRRAMSNHPAPTVTHEGPDRASIDAASLPTLARLSVTRTGPELEDTAHTLTDTTGREWRFLAGLGTTLLTLPDGSGVLIYQPRSVLASDAPGFRIPPPLMPDAQAMLRGGA